MRREGDQARWRELQDAIGPKNSTPVMWSLRQTMDANVNVMLKHIRRGNADAACIKAKDAAHAALHLLRIVDVTRQEQGKL